MNVLGISAFYHDAAAALVQDGKVIAAAQEERFTRRKHDASFPSAAIRFCMEWAGLGGDQLDAVAYYDKPVTTFNRLLRTYLATGPRGFSTFRDAIPLWTRQKLWIPYQIERGLRDLGFRMPKLYFCEHHQSHAASAFFGSPFSSAAVLTFDGVGEWATSSIGLGRGSELTIQRQLDFPHSLGLLYSAFTQHCGFEVNSGEYKLMGLAPFGEPTYVDTIRSELIDLRDDGSFHLDMRYFGYLSGDHMTSRRFDRAFGGRARMPDSPITQRELDLARSIQVVTEEIVLRMARHASLLTGERNVCLAGGVALNCVSNGRLLREGPFEDVWVQPAAGDAGGALGAAFHVWHQILGGTRCLEAGDDAMSGAALGPTVLPEAIRAFLDRRAVPYHEHESSASRARSIAAHVAAGRVVGLFTGRMEFGPRALGHRSILADARRPDMQSRLNLATKERESFRPFAPAVLEERCSEWFDLDRPAPYMTFVATVAEPHLRRNGMVRGGDLEQWVGRVRSDIPAVTHVDATARVQTVSQRSNPEFHEILCAFEELTGCPVMINTSFNGRDEPIVCTIEDAFQCFERTGLDSLVVGLFEIDRTALDRDAA